MQVESRKQITENIVNALSQAGRDYYAGCCPSLRDEIIGMYHESGLAEVVATIEEMRLPDYTYEVLSPSGSTREITSGEFEETVYDSMTESFRDAMDLEGGTEFARLSDGGTVYRTRVRT